MRSQLLRGFYLGDVLVEPLRGLVTGCGPPESLPPEAVDVLLHLASQPGELIKIHSLLDEVWGKNYGSSEQLSQTIQQLRNTLGDDPTNPSKIELVDGCYRLNGEVRFEHFPSENNKSTRLAGSAEQDQKELSSLQLFWVELKKRRVVRVALGYVIFAWAILQLADILLDAFELPDWSMKLVTVLLALGFVATVIVTWLLQMTPAGLRLDEPLKKTVRQDFRHLLELLIIFVLLIAVGYLGYQQFWAQQAQEIVSTAEATQSQNPLRDYEHSIAVLPFENMGDTPDDQYFGEGMAEEILNKLASVPSLKVAARTSSFNAARSGSDVRQISEKLHVDNVLEGSIRREGGRVRVTAQLVDATGFHLWSQTYDVKASGLLNIQSEVALEVARQIISSLPQGTQEILSMRPTANPEAYGLYMEGLHYLRLPRLPENLTEAENYLELALNLDPRYARAHAALCEVQLSWFRVHRAVEYFEKAERSCNRAVTLNAAQADVYVALGNLYRSSSQFEKAQTSFEYSLALNPFLEEANYGLARSMQGQGNLEEAEKLFRKGIEMEPGHWGPFTALGNFLHRMGRPEEAIPYFMTVTELNPESPDGFTNLGTAFFDSGDWESAEVAWKHSLDLAATPMAYRNMCTLYYYQGRYPDAVAMVEKALEMAPDDHWLWGKLGASARYVEGGADLSRSAYQEAIRLATERLSIEEMDSESMAYLAAYYSNIGVQAQASELISRAIALEPDNPDVWYFSGVVNVRNNKNDQAVSDLIRAAERGYSRRLLAADPQFKELHYLDAFRVMLE